MRTSELKNEPPRPLAQRLGAILWPSFLLAGVATMVLFAFVDPVELHQISFPDWELSRIAGYTIGFFMFWAVTAAASFGTWLLLRSPRRINAEQLDAGEPAAPVRREE